MGLQIPIDQVLPDLLRAVAEEFVLREGTDYGEREYSLEEKVTLVLEQLKCGKAVLLFDEQEKSFTIGPA